MLMAQKTNTALYAGDNVIPFTPRDRVTHHRGESQIITEHEVEILLCSLCGSSSFQLISGMEGQISCGECGYLTGAKWRPNTEE